MPIATVTNAITVSQLDSERFGIRAARACITSENLAQILHDCEQERVDLLIARCATDDIALVQNAETRGLRLTDTLLYYQFDLRKRSIPRLRSEFLIRSLQGGDEGRVSSVAASAFKNYRGHYHADSRLEREKCDQAYVSWAVRSCTPGLDADKVLIAEREEFIVGFGTLRVNSPDEVEGLLFAVSPRYQRRGICSLLLTHSLEWTSAQRAQRMIISTQLTNVAMQKVWTRMGFELSHSFYTFHKWFDR